MSISLDVFLCMTEFACPFRSNPKIPNPLPRTGKMSYYRSVPQASCILLLLLQTGR